MIGIAGDFNVISGNLGNGVLIAKLSIVPSTGNTLAGNDIGIGSNGSTILSNGQNGVLIENASNNAIGLASGVSIPGTNVPTAATISNVISGNGRRECNSPGSSQANFVQGDYIGVAANGTGSLGNAFAGVFVNNLGTASSGELIGGTGSGAGNVIAGSGFGYGIDILGPSVLNTPAGNLVQGNLVGIGIGQPPHSQPYRNLHSELVR